MMWARPATPEAVIEDGPALPPPPAPVAVASVLVTASAVRAGGSPPVAPARTNAVVLSNSNSPVVVQATISPTKVDGAAAAAFAAASASAATAGAGPSAAAAAAALLDYVDDDLADSGVSPTRRDAAKRPWTPAEDEKLMEMVNRIGPHKWPLIASELPGRAGKQCRERWFNHLCPSVTKGSWTAEEDKIIFDGVDELGKKWSEIVKRLPGRTDNSIKNRYNSQKRREARRERAAQTADMHMGSPGAVNMAIDRAIKVAKRVHGDDGGGAAGGGSKAEGKKRQKGETTIVLAASVVPHDEQHLTNADEEDAAGAVVADAVVATFTPPSAPTAIDAPAVVPWALEPLAQPRPID